MDGSTAEARDPSRGVFEHLDASGADAVLTYFAIELARSLRYPARKSGRRAADRG